MSMISQRISDTEEVLNLFDIMINSENSGMTVHDRGMQIMNILESLFCVGGYCLFLKALCLGVLKGFFGLTSMTICTCHWEEEERNHGS